MSYYFAQVTEVVPKDFSKIPMDLKCEIIENLHDPHKYILVPYALFSSLLSYFFITMWVFNQTLWVWSPIKLIYCFGWNCINLNFTPHKWSVFKDAASNSAFSFFGLSDMGWKESLCFVSWPLTSTAFHILVILSKDFQS